MCVIHVCKLCDKETDMMGRHECKPHGLPDYTVIECFTCGNPFITKRWDVWLGRECSPCFKASYLAKFNKAKNDQR